MTGLESKARRKPQIGAERGGRPVKSVIRAVLLRCGGGALFNALFNKKQVEASRHVEVVVPIVILGPQVTAPFQGALLLRFTTENRTT